MVCVAKFYDYSVDLIKRVDKGVLHGILTTLIDLGEDYFDFW
jgi:hypothetical protein